MLTLLSNLPPPEDREQQILLALGDFYGVTIPQVMELYGWQNYPKATIAFKRIVYEPKNHTNLKETIISQRTQELIYRVRRHGLGKESIPGDVYVLLTNGAKVLKEQEYAPAFSFEPNKAMLLRPGVWEHTLLVNEALIKLKLFTDAHPVRFRVEGGVHERSMRKEYEKAFKLYPDGLIRFLIKQGNQWKSRAFFLEVEHTSAHDKAKWQMKVRQYINLFEYKLQTYFQTDRIFVLVLVTIPEFVHHLVHWTEEALTDLGTDALSYRTWFCIGHLDMNLTPAQFFCLPRFYKPFEDAPREVFDGLVLAQPPVSGQR